MYLSPINKMYADITEQMMKQEEDRIMYTVKQTVGYDVDKNELIRALQYDRQQYDKGYKDAQAEAQKKVMDALAQISLKEYESDNIQYKKAINDSLDVIKKIWLGDEEK